MTPKKPVVLCILDGWGIGPQREGNAPLLAHTPTMDALMARCPNATLVTHGPDAGLPRGFGTVPTVSVTVFCAATAVLSAAVHLMTETTIWPGPQGWLAVLALGLGPVGLAFFVWDIGCKRGDIQLLGTASYAAPVLSTLALVGVGLSPASWALGAATVLIVGGAALAARASAGKGGVSAPTGA